MTIYKEDFEEFMVYGFDTINYVIEKVKEFDVYEDIKEEIYYPDEYYNDYGYVEVKINTLEDAKDYAKKIYTLNLETQRELQELLEEDILDGVEEYFYLNNVEDYSEEEEKLEIEHFKETIKDNLSCLFDRQNKELEELYKETKFIKDTEE